MLNLIAFWEAMATDSEPVAVEVTVTAKPVVDESIPLVLVTGATGYIATHAIQQLLSSGKYRVRGTVRSLKSEEKVKALKELVPDAKYPLDLCEADLQNKESWPPAVQGCKYVLHIASPFPSGVPKNPDVVIRPAVDGTVNVLTACSESGSVKKVVLTSSIAAISCGGLGHPNRQEHVYTEEDWSPPEACPPYERSKTLAEKAAWDFVKELPEEKKFDLAVINPGFVQGPAFTKASGTSVGMIHSMLIGKLPGAPDISFGVVDVRDVAQAHIIAMEKPECNGKRYLLVAESNVNFQQVLQWMAAEFNPQGYKVGTKKIPKFVAWFTSFLSSEMKAIYPVIGKRLTYKNDRLINELGIQPRPAKQSFIEAGYSIIELGMVAKTSKYYGPGGKPQPAADDKPTDTTTSTEDKPADTATPSSTTDDKPVDTTATTTDDKPADTTATTTDDKPADTATASSTTDDKPADTTATTTDDKPADDTPATTEDKPADATVTTDDKPADTDATTDDKPAEGISIEVQVTTGDEQSHTEAGTGKETEESVGKEDVKDEESADVPPADTPAEDTKDEVAEDKSQEPDEAKDDPEPQD